MFYIELFVFFMVTKRFIPNGVELMICVPMLLLFGKSLIYDRIQYSKLNREMKQKIKEAERKEEREQYRSWQSQNYYQEHQASKPEINENDTMRQNVKDMFEGYTKNSSTLKKRYRQLAKKYHPDSGVGGDEKVFNLIVEVYEELANLCGAK